MNKWINYHHLYYFKTIAEEGSVSKASEKLRIGQPTLSAQLKLFEETIGIQLFDRQHKKLILTEQGKIAFDYARNIFKMGSEMVEVLHDRLTPHKEHIHLAALDSIPKNIVMRLVKNSLKIAPCQITLSEGKPDELLREVAKHKIDLLITNSLPLKADTHRFSHRTISKTNVSFFGGEKFKHLKKNFPQSIHGVPVILPTYDSKLRYDIEHWAELNEIQLDIIIESQDISIKKLMATNEMGIIPLANHHFQKNNSSNSLYEIGHLVGVYEDLYLVSADRKIPNPIASQLFKKFSIT